ncbi:branched-chain alpha-keto acid dehydrogenase subunit E2 (lipoate acyltransferase) [Candidatus Phytoplasma mali]|uniref:Dihydrolipoamide acetyltransferase component of pyruvate dehydrogenase complex n=9 Tax=Apple proliferation phytoplasma TaxID=37692 RepID=B3R0H7_PHYMT|nr:dihydrolipoamide acetyltransferase family protein [Candidatus Phytoplasma mali]ANJ01580.1 pyruvate dehydrogenase [Candidatus Phytoplasma mali]ANN91077.1 dihydrolipoamide acetyltransferase [Candidatus Phytoplasma mali]ANN91078.1 dihydrolipoamide acetyltransferase [Candidatus Phytoplasma mali]ANN91080.1 dihydrolipoamide acetyltransferase [Candidatus Phytoplasma mali]ANN91081.1 dihydrolipoamide acetyltransferase [Candidatus Phytoplasma mali]
MFELKFADVGEGIDEGTVLKVYFQIGDKVKEGDILVTVETDKVNADLPAPINGVITKLGVKEGEMIHVGDMVAIIGDEIHETELKKADKEDDAGVVGDLENSSQIIETFNDNHVLNEINLSEKKILTTPLVRSMAKKLGIDLNNVNGSGINGKILKEDVERYQNENLKNSTSTIQKQNIKEQQSLNNLDFSSFDSEVIKISRLRKAISEQMKISKNAIVPTTLLNEINIDNLIAFRKKLKFEADSKNIKLTYMAFIMKAIVIVLKEFPIFNSSFNEVKDEIIIKKNINLGIAVDTEDGLIVPNIKNADKMNILELAKELEIIAKETRERKVSIEKLKNGTFTITNFGALGLIYGTPIINYPETAILGIGTIIKKPIVEQEEIIIANMLPLSLTIDHRIIDGADGGRFLKRFQEILNNLS